MNVIEKLHSLHIASCYSPYARFDFVANTKVMPFKHSEKNQGDTELAKALEAVRKGEFNNNQQYPNHP